MISDRIIISSDESMIDYMGKYNMKKAGISLKKQLLIIFLFIAFIPMTVTALLLYHFQTQNALNAEIESQIQVLKLVTSNIYQKLTYFNNLTASISQSCGAASGGIDKLSCKQQECRTKRLI